MVAYAAQSLLRQPFLASLALSSLLPFIFIGKWPESNKFVPMFSTTVTILIIAFSLLCSCTVPLITHWVLQQFNNNESLWTNPQLQANEKRRSLPVKKLCFFISSVTATQGMLTIAWGIYVGQISYKIADTEPIVEFLGIKNAWILGFSWIARLVAQVWFMLFIADFTNYGFHCLVHENKFLWKNMHYLHHENLYPEHAFFSLHYGSVIEMILSNFCFMCGMIVFKTDLATIAIFGLMSTIFTAAGHCGLDFSKHPWLEYLLEPNYHALHHRKFNVNYSEHFAIVDKWFGSYLAEDRRTKQLEKEDIKKEE